MPPKAKKVSRSLPTKASCWKGPSRPSADDLSERGRAARTHFLPRTAVHVRIDAELGVVADEEEAGEHQLQREEDQRGWWPVEEAEEGHIRGR